LNYNHELPSQQLSGSMQL